MKKIVFIVSFIALIGFVYLSIAGRNVQTIESEIEINASPEKVWDIITDVDKWHEWSPTINASEGKAEIGSTVAITMMSKEAGKDGPKYSPRVIQMDVPRYFHWRAHMMAGFIFTNDKIIELEKTPSGTKVIHKETFKGLMAAAMKGGIETGVPPMLNMMNEALKDMAEK